jgi:glutamate synthase domain-containing protein 3
LAGRILADWDRELAVFVRVMPVEYRKAIADGRVTGTKGKGSGRDAGNVSTVGR